MTFAKMKDGHGSQNSASGANSRTRTYLSRFFLITCKIGEENKIINKNEDQIESQQLSEQNSI